MEYMHYIMILRHRRRDTACGTPNHRATEDIQISASRDLILQMYDCVKSKAFPSVFQSFREYTAIGKMRESCLFWNTKIART